MITDPTELELTKAKLMAERKESLIRESCYLPIELDICGIPVKQFTPFHYVVLDFAINAHTQRHKFPEFSDTTEFLWVVSPEFAYNSAEKKNKWIENVIVKPLMDESVKLSNSGSGAMNVIYDELKEIWNEKACVEIYEYLDNAFMDKDETKKVQLISNSQEPVYFSWIECLLDTLNSQYGYNENYIHLPLTRINQMIRCMKDRNSEKPISFKNKYSTEAKDQLANYINNRAKGDNKIPITEELLKKIANE